MHRGNKYVASLFLSAALLAPMGAFAMAAPQDDRDRERHEERERERRVYDPYHKDYHNWDSREDQVYRRWLDERHQSYVDVNASSANSSAITGTGGIAMRSTRSTNTWTTSS